MMRSMFSGVSGLKNHQFRMDVIGNNIANVNTIGYKRARVSFQDMLCQTLSGASAPQGGKGGTNGRQIGLGMTINSIDVMHTQGSSETTGKVTDMMVDGDGFFIVSDGINDYYTRAGNFDFDSTGNLVNPAGLIVSGWMADSSGAVDITGPIGGIQIPKGQYIQPQPTTEAVFVGNLDADTAAADSWPASITVYDSLGRSWTMNVEFTKSAAAHTWDISLTNAPAWAALPAATVTFNPDGTLNAVSASPLSITGTPTDGTNDADPITIDLDLSEVTQYASDSNTELNSQDGYSSGVLNGYSIDPLGIITGRFSNGVTQQMAQVALASFNNPSGLTKSGENLYFSSNNSGQAQVGTAGSGGRGDISPGNIEMSNVDLSQEFTDMIVTQRGFQANSRIITVSDEMLQELVNLKR
ncbi:flagellar hook protein FlgE [Phosphitispora sp. TUW77]|uniref:flagellar hook protein FlgE n=1 Tax=Phosphitispora sp. TUW77 TaxID=3152361 RepID=UPI003AB7C6A9